MNPNRSISKNAAAGGETRWKREELWGMLGHDLRTPLNGIQGFLDLLSGTRLDSEQQEYVKTALECTEGLRSIFDGIIECARIESGQLLISTQATDFRELAASVFHQHRLQANRQGTELKTEIPPEFPKLLSLDKGKLRQILSNLVGNAVKFTRMGRVIVRADHVPWNQENLIFEVIDTGIGIPPDQIPSVFEAFYQCNRNDDGPASQGVGLGLAIVKKLVSTLGGRLSIQSAADRGTSVSVSLRCKT